MSLLFRRAISVQVNDLEIEGARVVFKIEKTFRREPNSLSVRIYNLSEDTRNRLDYVSRKRARTVPRTPGVLQPRQLTYVDLRAGYEESELHRLFMGDVSVYTGLRHMVEGADTITSILASDGGTRSYVSRVNRSFSAGTAPRVIFNHLVDALGIDPGVSREQFASAHLGELSRYYTGVVLSGSAADAMDDLCAAAGFEWSVQDTVLTLTRIRTTESVAAVVLTPDTGLLGTPTREGRYIIKGRCLIQPGVLPGKTIRVDSALVRATIRLYRVSISGDTHGGDWYIDFEGAPPRPPYATRVIPA